MEPKDIIVVEYGAHHPRIGLEHILTADGRNTLYALGTKLRGYGYTRPRIIALPSPQARASARVIAQALCGHIFTTIETTPAFLSRSEDEHKHLIATAQYVHELLENDTMSDVLIVVTHHFYVSELPSKLLMLLPGSILVPLDQKYGNGVHITKSTVPRMVAS